MKKNFCEISPIFFEKFKTSENFPIQKINFLKKKFKGKKCKKPKGKKCKKHKGKKIASQPI